MPLIEDPENSDVKKAVFWRYPRLIGVFTFDMWTQGWEHCRPTEKHYGMQTSGWRYTEWVWDTISKLESLLNQVRITYYGHHEYSPGWSVKKDDLELHSIIHDPQKNFNVAGHATNAEVRTEPKDYPARARSAQEQKLCSLPKKIGYLAQNQPYFLQNKNCWPNIGLAGLGLCGALLVG